MKFGEAMVWLFFSVFFIPPLLIYFLNMGNFISAGIGILIFIVGFAIKWSPKKSDSFSESLNNFEEFNKKEDSQ
jgi:hypothetical protein